MSHLDEWYSKILFLDQASSRASCDWVSFFMQSEHAFICSGHFIGCFSLLALARWLHVMVFYFCRQTCKRQQLQRQGQLL